MQHNVTCVLLSGVAGVWVHEVMFIILSYLVCTVLNRLINCVADPDVSRLCHSLEPRWEALNRWFRGAVVDTLATLLDGEDFD